MFTSLRTLRPLLHRKSYIARFNSTLKGADVHVPSSQKISYSLDYDGISENIEAHEKNIANRRSSGNPSTVSVLYKRRKTITNELNRIRTEANRRARRYGEIMRNGTATDEELANLKHHGEVIKKKVNLNNDALAKLSMKLEHEGALIPNLAHKDTPIDDPIILETVHNKPENNTDFKPESYLSLAKKHKLIDMNAGSKVSGRNFYYLQGELAMMELALIHWSMERLVSKGFSPYIPPDIVKAKYLEATGFQPRDEQQTQSFKISQQSKEKEQLVLSGTAEIQMAGLFSDSVHDASTLPLKTVSFSHAFRTESGQSGTQHSGIYRVNQFSKVEMFVITTPDDSERMHKELIQIQKDMYTDLGLHFNVVDIPAHDLGSSAYRKIDMEAWMPCRQESAGGEVGVYGEISSTSNCTDFQSRRLNIKISDPRSKDRVFCHTLNGTACAVPRLIIAILEQCQQKDGSIVIPKPLRSYMMHVEQIPDARFDAILKR